MENKNITKLQMENYYNDSQDILMIHLRHILNEPNDKHKLSYIKGLKVMIDDYSK